MTTFSQMVDDLVAESLRPDLQTTIVSYLNQTIRDVHFNQQNKSLIKYNDNLNEAITYGIGEQSTVWPIPSPQTFASTEAIYYPDVDSLAVERKPSMIHTLGTEPSTWYRSGQNLVFDGYGGIDAPIWIAYLSYPRQLVYYKKDRPCVWSDADQAYTYAPAYDGTPELQEAARGLATNWLLERWQHVILEGGRAKLYKRLEKELGMRAAYSSFESARMSLIAAESFENQVIFSR